MSEALYHTDPYTKEVGTEIKNCFEEDGKKVVVLVDRLFYPQGGGQKGDRGQIIIGDEVLEVVNTTKDQYSSDGQSILTVEGSIDQITPGTKVTAVLDWEHRYRQMRLHGAVHMHHCMMEAVLGEKIPNPKSSDIQNDGSAFNRYETKSVNAELVEKANIKLAELISCGSEVLTSADPEKKNFRWWHSDGFSIPCGGTHILNMSEVGDLEIAYSQRKGKPKVTISLQN